MILISSITGFNPRGNLSMYAVTKTALFGLTKVNLKYMVQNRLHYGIC